MFSLNQDTYLIIDFDSTFIKDEGLEELAQISLEKKNNKEEIIKKIKNITDLGMAGKIGFVESLKRRIELIEADREDVRSLAEKFKNRISDSISENKSFFISNSDKIYIISGGFEEFILPVIEDFGLSRDNVLANGFLFDEKGVIKGFDTERYLAQEKGKIKQVEDLNLDKEVFVVGDGWTDYEIRKQGLAEKFIAFVENKTRDEVVQAADYVAHDFNDVLEFLSL